MHQHPEGVEPEPAQVRQLARAQHPPEHAEAGGYQQHRHPRQDHRTADLDAVRDGHSHGDQGRDRREQQPDETQQDRPGVVAHPGRVVVAGEHYDDGYRAQDRTQPQLSRHRAAFPTDRGKVDQHQQARQYGRVFQKFP